MRQNSGIYIERKTDDKGSEQHIYTATDTQWPEMKEGESEQHKEKTRKRDEKELRNPSERLELQNVQVKGANLQCFAVQAPKNHAQKA